MTLRIRKPEEYVTAKEAADGLRAIAQDIENRTYRGEPMLAKFQLNVQWATQEDIEFSLKKDQEAAERRAKKKAKV